MSEVAFGVYKQAGQPDQLVPLAVDADGKLATTSTATFPAEIEVKNDSGNPVPVSFPSTPTVNVGTMPEVEVKNDSGNAIFTEPLGVPGVARQVTVTTTSANTQLTAGVKRISIKARTCDMRYAVGSTTQTASATTSHFLEAGERLDIAVPAGGHIAVIRDSAATANGTLCITELG